MSDFWRSLDFSLIKSKIKLDLSFPKILRTDEVPANLANNPAYDRQQKQLEQHFKQVVLNKYRSEVTTIPKNNNFDYMIHPTFRIINRLSVLLSKMLKMIVQEIFFSSITLVEIKDFNGFIDKKIFFDQPVKKRSMWKTCRNVKKQWSYNRKLIRLFVSSELL